MFTSFKDANVFFLPRKGILRFFDGEGSLGSGVTGGSRVDGRVCRRKSAKSDVFDLERGGGDSPDMT
jgi:hypothetical protein